IRTRMDKTESVMRDRIKYGNYIDTANKIWRSIINPFTMDDINILSKPENYQQHIKLLRDRISAGLISLERRENVYYQLQTNLAKPLRAFHNFVKSIILYTYASPKYNNNTKLDVLDFGCGRGGDIMKYFY